MKISSFFNTNNIPFVYSDKVSISKQGEKIWFLLKALTEVDCRDKTWEITKQCLKFNKIPTSSPFYKSARDIAKLIDSDSTYTIEDGGSFYYSGKDNDYHNSRHFQEVVLSSQFLLAINDTKGNIPLFKRDKALLLLASLLHDVGHTGETNTVPFQLELNSVALVAPIIVKYFGKNAASIIADLQAMVCCTDIINGSCFFDKMLSFHRGKVKKNVIKGKLPTYLYPLYDNATLAELTAILCDADIACSILYSFPSCWNATLNLSLELTKQDNDKQLVKMAMLDFLNKESVAIKSLSGKVFSSNFNKIKKLAKLASNRVE